MSATTAGAIKAYLESLGLGLAVYRDAAPQQARLPLVVVQEGISLVPEADGDLMDPEADHDWREQAQVTVHHPWRNTDGKSGENPALVAQVVKALHGRQLLLSGSGAPPTRVRAMTVDTVVRLGPTSEAATPSLVTRANIVSNVITVTIRRSL